MLGCKEARDAIVLEGGESFKPQGQGASPRRCKREEAKIRKIQPSGDSRRLWAEGRAVQSTKSRHEFGGKSKERTRAERAGPDHAGLRLRAGLWTLF